MKKFNLFFILIFLCGVNTYAGWERIVYQPLNLDFNDICVVSEKQAIAVGECGRFTITEDSGATWKTTLIDKTQNLISVSSFSESIFLTLSNSGNVYRTIDGGKSWHQVDLNNINPVNLVKCYPTGLCVITGVVGEIHISSDQGNSWTKISTQIMNNINDIGFTSPDEFIIIGDKAALFKYSHGSINSLGLSTQNNYNLKRISVTSENHFVILTDSLKTISTFDGGNSFKVNSVVSNFSSRWTRPTIVSFFCPNPSVCNIKLFDRYSSCLPMYEYASTDSCKSWKSKVLNDSPNHGIDLLKINFINENFGYGVGYNGIISFLKIGNDGFILYKLIKDVSFDNFVSVSGYDENNFIAVENIGYCGFWKTTDGGESWQKKDLKYLDYDSNYFNIESICYLSPRTFLLNLTTDRYVTIFNTTYCYSRGWIAKTTDDGNSFSYYSNSKEKSFVTFKMINQNYGFTAGYDYCLKYTTDGGYDWTDICTDDSSSNNYRTYSPEEGIIFFLRNNDYEGYILKTTNKGKTWINYHMFNNSVDNIKFFDESNGWCYGHDIINYNFNNYYSNYIETTSDGGKSWIKKYSGDYLPYEAKPFLDADFVDMNNGILVGYNGTVLKTSNGGETWEQPHLDNSINSENIIQVSFPTVNVAFAITNNGNIIRYTNDATSVNEENDAAKTITIFPNPASNSANLKFNLNDAGLTKISVLNQFGQEINVIYNSWLEGGEHNINLSFEKNTYSDGIYFIRLTSGNSTQTKKFAIVR